MEEQEEVGRNDGGEGRARSEGGRLYTVDGVAGDGGEEANHVEAELGRTAVSDKFSRCTVSRPLRAAVSRPKLAVVSLSFVPCVGSPKP